MPNERRAGAMGRLVEGVDGVRRIAREELRAGAHFIKWRHRVAHEPNSPLQYSEAEIYAVVEEADNAGTYVSAHPCSSDLLGGM